MILTIRKFHKMYTGVLQGTAFGSLLFLININDAPNMKNVKNVILVDDKWLFTSSYKVDAIKNRLQTAAARNIKFFE